MHVRVLIAGEAVRGVYYYNNACRRILLFMSTITGAVIFITKISLSEKSPRIMRAVAYA